MERVKNNDNNQKKQINKLNNKNEMGMFIKEHILKKFMILAIAGIIGVILIISTLYLSTTNIGKGDEIAKASSLFYVVKEKAIILLLILFAGWVPYFYIPAVSYIAYIFMLSGDIVLNMQENGALLALFTNTLPAVIDIITTSVIVAIGIYMCNYSSKKYKYAQRKSFSFLDVKIQFYEMTKNEEKYNQLVEKKEKRIEDMKKNDVKIDYKQIIKIVPIMIAINLLMTIIEYYIN